MCFWAKYSSSNGAHQWSGAMGGTGTDYPSGLAVDANNNIYMGGPFSQQPTSIPHQLLRHLQQPVPTMRTLHATMPAVIIILLMALAVAVANQAVTSLVLTSPDNLYLCGSNIGTGCDFDPGHGTAIISALGLLMPLLPNCKACPDQSLLRARPANNTPCSDWVTPVVSGFLVGAVGGK